MFVGIVAPQDVSHAFKFPLPCVPQTLVTWHPGLALHDEEPGFGATVVPGQAVQPVAPPVEYVPHPQEEHDEAPAVVE